MRLREVINKLQLLEEKYGEDAYVLIDNRDQEIQIANVEDDDIFHTEALLVDTKKHIDVIVIFKRKLNTN